MKTETGNSKVTKNSINFIFWLLKTTLCQNFKLLNKCGHTCCSSLCIVHFSERMISEGCIVTSSSLNASFADGWCAWSTRCHEWDSLERCDAFFISKQILHPLETCVMGMAQGQRKVQCVPNDGSHVKSGNLCST